MSIELENRGPETAPASLVDSAELSPEAQARPEAAPVAASERHFAVDVLRGCALLGILAMNIVDFGWPGVAYGNPMAGGGFQGTDRVVWFFNHLVFEAKMMTLFSMLFGAGLVLLDARAQARGASIRGIYYRRVLWLLVIGLVHSYLIWAGDILVLYAETGLILYLFHAKSPRTLIILGLVASLLIVPIVVGFAWSLDYMKAASARVEVQTKAGEKPSWLDRKASNAWKNMRDEFDPTPAKKAEAWDKEMAIYRGGYWGIVKNRAGQLIFVQTLAFIFGLGFVAASRMLIGMALMKLGVFSAERSKQFYLWMVALGYGIGMPLMVFDALELIKHEFSFVYGLHGGFLYNLFGSLVVAMGHVGLVMLIVKAGLISWLTRRLAAVGRMALTNYLTHSIVCTTLFYGYGFALFGTMNRTALFGVVVVIWTVQLIVSPIWLKYFRFGPAEWVWRSLTYWRPQPMRVAPAGDLPATAA